MRIVGGSLRGRPLQTPTDRSIRPTSDRVREALFNILTHAALCPSWQGLEDLRVLDVFAGSGALGIEALSRGAAHVDFLEQSAGARKYLNRNLARLDLMGRATIHAVDACRPPPAKAPAALALLDPPYRSSLGEQALEALAGKGWLTDHAIVVLETAAPETIRIGGFTLLQTRRYGGTSLLFMCRDGHRPTTDTAL